MGSDDRELSLIDGSRLIIEALARAGAEVYVGYPITPANWLYAYAQQRFPYFLPAPDEISALQWAAGFSASGKIAVSATSFPGFALMLETLNMAYMMELPLVLVLSQRMGPSTGSATTGAQGDLLLLRGAISGGYPLPVLSPSNLEDCWTLAGEAVRMAGKLRTPVVLLTSKEMVMTQRSLNLSDLPEIEAISRDSFSGNGTYQPYASGQDLVPPFLPVGDDLHQVRLNASTHDATGLIRKATPEALANTRRLREKVLHHLPRYSFYELDEQEGAGHLIVSYGISADAAREALGVLRAKQFSVSLLIVKTLIPFPDPLLAVIKKYTHIHFVEENLTGQLRELVFGKSQPAASHPITAIGRMIAPGEIIKEVEKWQR